MILYSFKGQEPKPLPHRISLPNGFTRTDSSTFTDLEISEAGFSGPYALPDFDPQTQQVIWVDGDYEVTERPPEPEPEPEPEPLDLDVAAQLMIDAAAGNDKATLSLILRQLLEEAKRPNQELSLNYGEDNAPS